MNNEPSPSSLGTTNWLLANVQEMLSVCERKTHLSSSDSTAVMHQGFSNHQHFLLNILDLFRFYTSLKQYCFSDQFMALVQESFIQMEKKFVVTVTTDS